MTLYLTIAIQVDRGIYQTYPRAATAYARGQGFFKIVFWNSKPEVAVKLNSGGALAIVQGQQLYIYTFARISASRTTYYLKGTKLCLRCFVTSKKNGPSTFFPNCQTVFSYEITSLETSNLLWEFPPWFKSIAIFSSSFSESLFST